MTDDEYEDLAAVAIAGVIIVLALIVRGCYEPRPSFPRVPNSGDRSIPVDVGRDPRD